jgi:hypothetical protein
VSLDTTLQIYQYNTTAAGGYAGGPVQVQIDVPPPPPPGVRQWASASGNNVSSLTASFANPTLSGNNVVVFWAQTGIVNATGPLVAPTVWDSSAVAIQTCSDARAGSQLGRPFANFSSMTLAFPNRPDNVAMICAEVVPDAGTSISQGVAADCTSTSSTTRSLVTVLSGTPGIILAFWMQIRNATPPQPVITWTWPTTLSHYQQGPELLLTSPGAGTNVEYLHLGAAAAQMVSPNPLTWPMVSNVSLPWHGLLVYFH